MNEHHMTKGLNKALCSAITRLYVYM